MDLVKAKAKKGLITKTWERCKSLGQGRSKSPPFAPTLTRKSKSCPHISITSDDDKRRAGKNRVVPEGCFSVYVGPQKQRFVIKTEYVNHPLFKMLLEEAESEYGFNSDGPLTLPCQVDLFLKMLLEMEGDNEIARQRCGFSKGHHGSYHLLTPPRMIAINQF